MKVIVTIKEVAEVQDAFEIVGTKLHEQYLDYNLNEWDEYAIEAGVQFAEEHNDVEVVGVTIGPERSEETIRMALAMGVDRAVRVWDDALDDKELLDVGVKAEILAAVIKEEDPDFVVSGVQASDDSFGATGVALADEIGFAWASVVNEFEIDIEEGIAHVHRELEGGVEEVTDIQLPAVLAVQTGLNDPRYASLRGIRQAQRKEITTKDLTDLGLDISMTDRDLRLTGMKEPEAETDAVLFDGEPSETAAQLGEVLRERGVGAE